MKGYKEIERQIHNGHDVKKKCFFCKAEVSGEFYCFGCHEFVCSDCESPDDPPVGIHSVEEHRS